MATSRVVIVGAGAAGSAAAAALDAPRVDVVVIGAEDRPPYNRTTINKGLLAGAVTAHDITLPRLDGGHVAWRLGQSVTRIDPDTRATELDDRDRISADAVVVALGVQPVADLLPSATTHAGDPIIVDSALRVPGHRGLYAAGDVAAAPGVDRQPASIQHWGSALAHGKVAAATVLADLTGMRDHPGRIVPRQPSYSTYVHDTKITILGRPDLATHERPVEGTPDDPRFTIALLDASHRVVGVVGVGGARTANRLAPLIDQKQPVTEIAALLGTRP